MFGKPFWAVALAVLLTAVTMGTAKAATTQAIVGSWCLDVTRSGVTRPAIINFSADGNLSTIPDTPFPSADIPDSTDRTGGMGEVTKVGPRAWEANFNILFTKLGSPPNNYNGRQAIRLSIGLNPSGTIDGDITITVIDKNDNVINTITGSYTGMRMDASSAKLCDFNISPAIP